MRSSRIALAAGLAGALGAALLPAAAASAATQPLIASLNSTSDPQYAQNQQRFSDTGLVQTDGQGGAQFFATGWNLDLRPATGTTFKPGLYTDVSSVVSGSSTSAHAYADITVGQSGEGFAGDVDVLDWVAGSNGVPTRFDIVFRTSAALSAQGYFGELRMGEDATSSPVLAARHLEWSPTPVGGSAITATEWVHNESAQSVRVGTPTVSGSAAADFTVRTDSCGTLAAGAKCSFAVAFSPKAAGPRIAALSVPVGGTAQTVSLTGSAPLGTTSFTTSGADALDNGSTRTWTEGGSAQFWQATNGCGYTFGNTAPYALFDAANAFEFEIGAANGAVPTTGTRATTWCDPSRASLNVQERGYSFGGPTGTETVKRFDVAADGSVQDADITFTISDGGSPMTGHFQYRARTDYTPTAAPTTVTVTTTGTTRTLSWSAPSGAVSYVARLVPGTAGVVTATSGLPISAGTATTATLSGLTAGTSYTVAVFALDAAGNVSSARTTTVTG